MESPRSTPSSRPGQEVERSERCHSNDPPGRPARQASEADKGAKPDNAVDASGEEGHRLNPQPEVSASACRLRGRRSFASRSPDRRFACCLSHEPASAPSDDCVDRALWVAARWHRAVRRARAGRGPPPERPSRASGRRSPVACPGDPRGRRALQIRSVSRCRPPIPSARGAALPSCARHSGGSRHALPLCAERAGRGGADRVSARDRGLGRR